jgi:hypothetical protein
LGFSLLAPFLTAGTIVVACSSQAPLVGQGGQCQLATDCQDGLICAPAKGSNVCPCTCTSDLSGVQQLPPTPDAGPGQAAADVQVSDDVQIPTSVPEASSGG